jgi:hypothetical protein
MNASLIRQGAFLFLAFLTGSDTGWQVKARSRLFAVGGVRQDRAGPRTGGAIRPTGYGFDSL